MLKYRVTIPLPDGATSIAIWEYDMDSEQIWALVSEALTFQSSSRTTFT